MPEMQGAERGAVVLLLGFLLAAVLSFLVVSADTGRKSIVLRQLQTSADSAANSGVSLLCSSRKCFEDARSAAIRVLNQHHIQSSLGADSSVSLDESNPGSTWELSDTSNLRVSIERGYYSQEEGGFVSLEDGSWQLSHPGVPAFVVADSLRVQISRPATRFFSSLLSSRAAYTLSAQSVASKSSRGVTVRVAPFAIPICSLIRSDGEYMGWGGTPGTSSGDLHDREDESCLGDRIFTRADHYCPAGSSGTCNAMPAFPWNPCDERYQGLGNGLVEYNPTFRPWPEGISSSTSDLICRTTHGYTADREMQLLGETPGGHRYEMNVPGGWNGQQYYPDIADHFGLVGIPSTAKESDEYVKNSLLDKLVRNGTNPYFEGRIGSKFSFLENGLEDPEFDEALWRLITNADGTQPERMYTPLSASVMGSIRRDLADANFVLNYSWYHCDTEWVLDDRGRPTLKCIPGTYQSGHHVADPLLPAGRGRGMCNSRRRAVDVGSVTPGIVVFSRLFPFPHDFDLKQETVSGQWGYHSQEWIDRVTRLSGPQPTMSAFSEDDVKVWNTQIPVVADFSGTAQTCKGIAGAQTDPQLQGASSSSDLRIVGFVNATISDVDIGKPPPRVVCVRDNMMFGNELCGIEGSDAVERWMRQISSYSFGPPVAPTIRYIDGLSFQNNCNLVRARLSCERKYLPGSADESAKSRIVS